MSQLREKFLAESKITWINGDGEPDIEYVEWLEGLAEAGEDMSKLLLDIWNEVQSNRSLRLSLPIHLANRIHAHSLKL